ncbi:MAG: hypothetical protein ACRC6U_10240 [Fusobacteriaceae bacterium]
MNKKRFYTNILLIVLTLIGIASFVFVVDPGKIFFNNYSSVAKEVLKNNIEIKSNIEERIFKKEVIKNFIKKNDLLILGSSRVMLIGNENFIEKTVFNAGVSGAGLEDQLALLNIYLKEIGYPKEILFGIDPWTFNLNSDNRWEVLREDYFDFKNQKLGMKRIQKEKKYFKNIYKLIEFMYLKDSIKYFFKNDLNKNNDFYSIVSESDKYNTKGNVYSKTTTKLIYSKKYREINDGSNWKSGFGYQLKNYYELDKNLKLEFLNTLEFLKSKDIKIKIFLPYYNPELIESQEKEKIHYNNMLRTVEKFVREESKLREIEILGSYFSKELKSSDFYDGIHLREEKLKTILIN